MKTKNAHELQEWCYEASVGYYLTTYEDCGSNEMSDPGSRCGYSDVQLDTIKRLLQDRGMYLLADDRGLIVMRLDPKR